MATVTASDQLATPRAVHAGVNAVRTTYTQNGATLSASDIILVAKIPNGALVLDGYMSGTSGAAATILKLGIQSGTETQFIATGTLSATAQLQRFIGGALPFKVSLSDDANPQYTWVYATMNSGSATVTGSIQFVVSYLMP